MSRLISIEEISGQELTGAQPLSEVEVVSLGAALLLGTAVKTSTLATRAR